MKSWKYRFEEGSTFPLNGTGNVVAGSGGVTLQLSKDGNGWRMYVNGNIQQGAVEKPIRESYQTNSSAANYVMRHGKELR